MAINTDTIRRLLSACADFHQALQSASAIVRTERENVAFGRITAEQALVNLGLMLQADLLLQNPVETLQIMLLETERIKFHERKNRAERRRRARRRLGLPYGADLPPDVAASLEPKGNLPKFTVQVPTTQQILEAMPGASSPSLFGENELGEDE